MPEEWDKTVKSEGQGWEKERKGDGEDESVRLAGGRKGGRGHPQSIDEASVIQRQSREQRFVYLRESQGARGEEKKKREGGTFVYSARSVPSPFVWQEAWGISRGCENPRSGRDLRGPERADVVPIQAASGTSLPDAGRWQGLFGRLGVAKGRQLLMTALSESWWLSRRPDVHSGRE